VCPVQVDDDSNCHRSFCGSYSDNEYGKEKAVQPVGPEIFIKSDKVDIYAVQDELNTHEHRNKIAPCKKTVHSNEEECRTDK
jgi:hypothetical protein